MDLPIKRRCYIGAKCRGNSSTVLTGCHPSCPPRVPPLPMKRATSPQWYVSVSHCYDQSDIRVAVRMKHKTQGLSWVDLSSCELNTPFTAMLARLCIKNQRMNESFILVIHADEQNVTIVTCADMQLTRHHHKCLIIMFIIKVNSGYKRKHVCVHLLNDWFLARGLSKYWERTLSCGYWEATEIWRYTLPLNHIVTTTAAMGPCDVMASTGIDFSHSKVKYYKKL
jgi:hypothetical protein